MTELTDAETAEIQWASDGQGKAAVRAAWDRAEGLGLDSRPAGMADVGAIVYAAYVAGGWDAEPMEDDEEVAAHLHSWTILGTQPHTPPVLFGKPVPHTIVLVRCSECGEPDTRMLPGEWTAEDLQRDGR
jgi:hypothetical protein